MKTVPGIRLGAARVLLLCLAASTAANAADSRESAPSPGAPASQIAADPLQAIQSRWAEIRYATPEAQRVAAYEALLADLERSRQAHPQDLRLLVWEGIVLSSEAGAKGGLGALSLVKRAKADFEQVIAQSPDILDGSAYTSLGSLYYQVPGWPLGFGDEDKARAMLRKGLEIAPNGIDANFFYADFLHDQGDDAAAKEYLQRALAAHDRPGRELADQGRREEARTLLAKVEARLR